MWEYTSSQTQTSKLFQHLPRPRPNKVGLLCGAAQIIRKKVDKWFCTQWLALWQTPHFWQGHRLRQQCIWKSIFFIFRRLHFSWQFWDVLGVVCYLQMLAKTRSNWFCLYFRLYFWHFVGYLNVIVRYFLYLCYFCKWSSLCKWVGNLLHPQLAAAAMSKT